MSDTGLPRLIGVKVLVVEDDEATRYAWSRQLARTGATVVTAEDAEHALAVLKAEAIDVLLADLALPG
jgi:CheY-like chemotaxis protein